MYLFQGGPPQQQGFYPQEQQSIALASLEQHQGTIFPSPNFNVEADCHALSHAMKGAGMPSLYLSNPIFIVFR